MITYKNTEIVLRNSKLTSKDIPNIIEKLHPKIKVFSLSYNDLRDEGIVRICEELPLNIEQIGLVDCNIGDVGGEALIIWIKKTNKLNILCIEQNNFSPEMCNKFRKISTSFQLFI